MNEYRLKDLVRINSRTLTEATDPDLRFRYIDIGSVDELGRVTLPDEDVRFAEAPSRARRLAVPGSTIVSTVRTYLRAIATVPQTDDSLVFSTGFAVLEPTSSVDHRFLFYWCRAEPLVQEVVARSVGVSYPAINSNELGDFKVQLPSLGEQRRIADFLDAETEQIHYALALRCRQAELLDEASFSHISEMLVPGSTSSREGRGQWSWLPPLPKNRPLVSLGFICRLQNGLTVDASRDVSGDVVTRPYLRVANVQAGHLDLESVTEITVPQQVARRTTLRAGDVLMTEGGDLDKLGRGTVWQDELPGCLHQNHIFALRPDPTRLDSDYLALLTQSVHGRCYFESTGVRTTNLASTNSQKILDLPVPLAGLGEQQRIVHRLKVRLEAIERAKKALNQQVAWLLERRQALVTAAVRGEMDVTTAWGVG